jgi:hypothetical protein
VSEKSYQRSVKKSSHSSAHSQQKRTIGTQAFREIVINTNPLKQRVALLEDGILKDFSVEYNDQANVVGVTFNGKVQNLDAALTAAFVDVGLNKNAFLHDWSALPAALIDKSHPFGIHYLLP